jgi:hypothetical protein
MRLLAILCLAALPTLAQQNFYQFSVDQDRLSGAVDFSYLNHPLTAADKIFVRDGHFYRVGPDLKPGTADDERVRFFGVNLVFGASFPDAQDAPRIAKRLRRLGVNMVRLHHMDSSPDRDPTIANSTLTTQPYPTLNSLAVARLRRLLDYLKAEGIYADLNLHVGYRFRPDVDGVPPLPGAEMPTRSKPLHIFYPRMIVLQEEYARKLIEALKLKGDPVLAVVEIDNETSLLQAWMGGQLDRCLLGDYKSELEKQWTTYLKRDAPLVAAKDTASPLVNDYLLFLADRDRYYLGRIARAARSATDNSVPITGTQMGYGGLLNLDSQAAMDYQDNHFYIDHYNFPNRAWDPRDWRIRDASSVGSGLSAFLNMAAARVTGQPYTVSEFNQPWPNRQAAESDPTLAAFAAFQDWDGIMHFAYSHGRDWDIATPNSFNINGDWTKFPNVGQSAWLFRAGAVQAGKSPIPIPVSRDLELRFGRERKAGAVAPFLKSAAGYDPALALAHPVGLKKQESGNVPAETAAAPYRSDTGELLYDPAGRVYVIQGEKAAGVIGFAGTRKIAAGAIDVQLAPSARGFAAIVATALDDRPLAQSARILITTPGYTLGTVPGADPPQMQKLVLYAGAPDWWTIAPEPRYADRPSGPMNGGTPPVWMERVESTVTLRSSAKALTVYPLDGAGRRLAGFAAEKLADGFRIHLQADGQQFAPWYEVAGK